MGLASIRVNALGNRMEASPIPTVYPASFLKQHQRVRDLSFPLL